uniref:Uncharacterized protein n=1 Tax=Chenopodium quinoa TaxID=63459 RepID=A0A803NDB6_CHEQI
MATYPDANSGDLFLSTGGGIGNPSPQTAANWFKIEKRRGDPGFYQLEYCPSSNTIDAFATKKDIVCGLSMVVLIISQMTTV